jgi:predicted lipoprotein with Yx(FWY)xxD motif
MSAPSISNAKRGLGGLVVIAVLAAACSSAASSAPATTAPATSAPATSPAASPAASPAVSASASSAASSASSTGVVVNMATTSLGPVLTGASGLTLYTHAGDTATSSTCTGGCATAWPPLTVAAGATATAGTGVTGTLGTLTRTDGTTQVTYNGMPLYGWKSDTKPGDVTGQGIAGFSVAKP